MKEPPYDRPDFEPEVAARPTTTASDRTDNSSLKHVAATWLHDWFSLPEAQNKQLVENLPSRTSSHAVAGKQCYISPEQFRGNATIKSDIYSLGGVSFWLLTGRDPEPISVSHPRSVNLNVGILDGIVAKATALDSSER